MDITINLDTIEKIAVLLTSLGVIGGVVMAVLSWFGKQRKTAKDVNEIKSELCELSFCILAALDGLKQLGANGNVTKAYDRLEKHLNKQAHDQL